MISITNVIKLYKMFGTDQLDCLNVTWNNNRNIVIKPLNTKSIQYTPLTNSKQALKE